ncbi:MAG: ComEC/Rec2 family competence protein, partial [Brachybacterium sp.]|nr:ComEC/Rec2 family competence protein [Brachybacterium sp.]
MLTRPDLRLLPSATVLWVLAALGVHHGPGPMLIACGGVVVLALLAGVLGRRPAVLRAVLAHLALLGIGASVLTLSVHRHESTLDVLREAQQDGRVLEVEVTARSDAEESTSGPAWAR